MKFIKFVFIMTLLVGGLGYGAYYFGTDFASNKIAATVSAEIENRDGNELKQVVNSYPEVKQFIDEGANVDEDKLPFTTMEDATKTIVKKVGLIELQKMHAKYENGLSESEVQQLVKELETKLTEEEILALKAIAYKELNK